MATAAGGVIVDPGGETVTVNLTQTAGKSITVYSDNTLLTTVTLPVTVSSAQSLYVAETDAYTLSCKLNGVEMAGGLGSTLAVFLTEGHVTAMNPVRTLKTSAYTFQAGDYGYSAWSCPITTAGKTYTLATAGKVYVSRFHVPNAVTITNLNYYVSTAGGTLTSGQSFVGLYSSAGAKLGVSASQSTLWATAGLQATALTTPYSAAAGDYYAAFWYNGTTGPTFAISSNNTHADIVNAGYSTNFIAGTADTSVTTTAPTTLAAQTSFKEQIWVATS